MSEYPSVKQCGESVVESLWYEHRIDNTLPRSLKNMVPNNNHDEG